MAEADGVLPLRLTRPENSTIFIIFWESEDEEEKNIIINQPGIKDRKRN